MCQTVPGRMECARKSDEGGRLAMRIERLPQENPRTQGPERRAWYRTHSPEHLRAIADLVEAALRAVRGRAVRAVVLGAGACTELPLERMARACESVLLVDVDVPGMLRARDEVPQSLRSRIDVAAADLTGGVSHALAAELRMQPWGDLATLGGPSGRAELDATAACIDRCPVPDPPVFVELAPGGYDLVISSFVLTQLFSLPLLDVIDMLNLHASGSVDMRDSYPRYSEAAQAFRRRIAQAHLSLIGSLLAPEGAGLLLTDMRGYLLPPRKGVHAGAGATPEVLDVLPPDVLTLPDDVAARFAVEGDVRRWRWLVSAPATDMPGRAYDACGILFRQRASG
ncbi:MAG: hypothetical protein ACXWQR_22575, partial [Ktedonobacterales bacterium]